MEIEKLEKNMIRSTSRKNKEFTGIEKNRQRGMIRRKNMELVLNLSETMKKIIKVLFKNKRTQNRHED